MRLRFAPSALALSCALACPALAQPETPVSTPDSATPTEAPPHAETDESEEAGDLHSDLEAQDDVTPGQKPGEAHRMLGHLPPQMRGVFGPLLMGRRHFQPHALVQVQAGLYTQDDAQLARLDRAENEGFAMRRARFGFSGRLGRSVDYGIETDLLRLKDGALSEAWIALTPWNTGRIIVGAHKMPFSRSALLGSGRQAMIERPIAVQALAPFRQIGVTLGGRYDLLGLRWDLGIYNAFERSNNPYGGYVENSGLVGNRFGGQTGEHFRGLSYAGRIALEPLGKMGPSVADTSGGKVRAAVGGGGFWNDGGTTQTSGYAVDLHVKSHGGHVLVEFLQDTAKPEDDPQLPAQVPADITRRGLVAEVGYTFWRTTIAGRYEQIDLDTERPDTQSEQVISASLGYQLPGERLRLQVQFDHRVEDGDGQARDNDVAFAQLQLML